MSDHLVFRLGSQRIGLDVSGGELAYISHAHTDHCQALGGPLPVFCSDITADLLGLQMAVRETLQHTPAESPAISFDSTIPAEKKAHGRKKARKSRLASRNQSSPQSRIPIPDSIELHNAGHILGSTQLSAQSEQFGRLVYTADFKLRDGLTTKGAPIIECDTLISECTFADPSVHFPPLEEVLSDMERWARQNRDCIQLWGGYSRGKAQELVKFINDYLGETPIVGSRIAGVCAQYARNGVKLRWLEAQSEEGQEAMRGPFMGILPPHQLKAELTYRISLAHRRKTKSAIATGWAQLRPIGSDVAFPLSDHADFHELSEYAKNCSAKRVIMALGDNARAAKNLRECGISAIAIEQLGQGQMVLSVETQ